MEPNAGRRQQGESLHVGSIPTRFNQGKASPQNKALSKWAAVTPAIKRVAGKQVFRAGGFLRQKAAAMVQKGEMQNEDWKI